MSHRKYRLHRTLEVDPVLPSDPGTENLRGGTHIHITTPVSRATLTTTEDDGKEIMMMSLGNTSRGTCHLTRGSILNRQAGTTATVLETLGTRALHLTGVDRLAQKAHHIQEALNNTLDLRNTIPHLMLVFQ